jgi:hypothetical protein
MSALSTNISKGRSKRRRILSGWRRLLTGQPYLVRTRDGKEVPLNAWLTNALQEHRDNEVK